MKNDVTAMHEKTLEGAEGIRKIGELIKGIHIAMMTTVTENGDFRSRPMATQNKEFDGSVYFLTKINSEKVDEIQQDAHVLLTYADTGASKYVTLQGRGSVSRDKAKVHELWNPLAKAWFPEGEEDPSIAVVRVVVTGAEFWDANASKAVQYVKMAVAAATHRVPDTGDHGRVKVAS